MITRAGNGGRGVFEQYSIGNSSGTGRGGIADGSYGISGIGSNRYYIGQVCNLTGVGSIPQFIQTAVGGSCRNGKVYPGALPGGWTNHHSRW